MTLKRSSQKKQTEQSNQTELRSLPSGPQHIKHPSRTRTGPKDDSSRNTLSRAHVSSGQVPDFTCQLSVETQELMCNTECDDSNQLQMLRTTWTALMRQTHANRQTLQTNKLTDAHSKFSIYKRQHPDIWIISINTTGQPICSHRRGNKRGVGPTYNRE